MKKLNLLILAALALASCGSGAPEENAAQTAQTNPIGDNPLGCARFFVAGQAPQLRDQRLSTKAKPLCRRTFALYHSGVARQPLWVAEALTREQIKMGLSTPRVDSFHADDEIPKDERAELADYAKSGYDRGHMAPEADMPSREASIEAFALSNMSPQRPGLNRKSWADLEAAVRRQTRGGTVYVVTGPILNMTRSATTNKRKRVLVPTHFFKAVYAEDRGAVVFIATNDDRPRWMTLTVDQFKQVHGINPFPGLPEQFANVNGVLDGSMNRVATAADASGAAANSPQSGTAVGPICRGDGRSTAGMVANPTNDQPMKVEDYRRAFGKEPRPNEYCDGPRGQAAPSGGGSGGATTGNSGTTGSAAGSTQGCPAGSRDIVINPTSGQPMRVEDFRRAFGREPGAGDYCK